jgi:chromosome segregation ATPase
MPIHLLKKRNCRTLPTNPTDMNLPNVDSANSEKRSDEYEKKIKKIHGEISLIKRDYENKLVEQVSELAVDYQERLKKLSEHYEKTIEDLDKEHKETMTLAYSSIDLDKERLDNLQGPNEGIKTAIDAIEEKLRNVESELPTESPKLTRQKGIIKKKKTKKIIYPNKTLPKPEALPKWK